MSHNVKYVNPRIAVPEGVHVRYIPGYDGMYAVSSIGDVLSCQYGVWRKLKATINHNGYLRVGLRKNMKAKLWRVHRLVLLAFVGPCPEGMESCHKNGKRTDNRLENLYYGTPSENQQDSISHGTFGGLGSTWMRGEGHGRAVLVESQVGEIRRRYFAGERICDIARDIGHKRKTVQGICRNETWKHCHQEYYATLCEE